MLRTLREGVFDHSFLTRDKVAVSELGTFGWHKVSATKPGYKARAKKRKHDDMVIALAGALFVAKRVFRGPRQHKRGMDEGKGEELVIGAHGVVLSHGPPRRRMIFR